MSNLERKTNPDRLDFPVLSLVVIAGLSLAGCFKPYFIVPGANTSELPTKLPPAPSMLIACEENARSLLIPDAGVIRWNGPLDVSAISNSDTKKKASSDCLNGKDRGYCTLPVKEQTTLELSVGVLPKAGSATGFLCFCKNTIFPWARDCTVDCSEKRARIDYKVTCSETRFIRRSTSLAEAELPLQPLPAHLPLSLKCKGTKDASGDLDCGAPIVLLEDSTVDVYGALRLSGSQALKTLEKGVALKFIRGDSEGPDAFVCLHGACSNPLYFLPLKVTFSEEPPSK